MAAGVAAGQTRTVSDAGLDQRLKTFERALAVDPENLQLAAQYRQATIAAGLFDRAIDFFEKQAGRKGGGPDVQISLALAYVDKVPTAGDIRRLSLGRDAMSALTRSIAKRPCVLAYYMRGLINLYYNRFIFRRTDNGAADLTQALSMVTNEYAACSRRTSTRRLVTVISGSTIWRRRAKRGRPAHRFSRRRRASDTAGKAR